MKIFTEHLKLLKPCGDHNTEGCSCGEPVLNSNEHWQIQNEDRHNFKWEEHIKEIINEQFA